MIVFLLLVGVVAIVVIACAALQDVYLPPVGDAPVATPPPDLPIFDGYYKLACFTDIQVKSIKGVEGWSSVSFKVDDRQYRLDMEDEFAKELEKRLQ